MSTTAIQQQTAPALPKTVKGWLTADWFKTQVALCLPKHLTADRFCRVALTALTRVPKLAECTPESVIKSMLTCSELGIEPDGRRAHLIPFWNTKLNAFECQLIIDYKGLVELAKRSGDVASITAQIVCDNDQFSWNTGEINHVINFKTDRGPAYAAYSVIVFKDGTKQADVMTRQEIETIRKRSRAGQAGPWVSDWNEMAKKTVFRRLSKWITLSPEMADALDRDADNFAPPASLVADMRPGPAITDAAGPADQQDGPPAAQAPTDEQAEADMGLAPARKRGRPPKQATAAPSAPVEAPKAPAEAPKPTVEDNPQKQLLALVEAAGYTFQDLMRWGLESGNIPDADSLPDISALPTNVAMRLLRAQVGLLKALEMLKGQQQ